MFRSICFILSSYHILEIRFIINYFQKKIAINNKELKEVLNEKYKKTKMIGSGAQGTVYEVEDLNEDRKRLIYFYLCSNKLIV